MRNINKLGYIDLKGVLQDYDPVFNAKFTEIFDYEISKNYILIKAKDPKYTSPIFTKGISSDFRNEKVKLPKIITVSPDLLIVSGICVGDAEVRSGTFGNTTIEYVKLVWDWYLQNGIPLLGIGVTVKTELLKKLGEDHFRDLAHQELVKNGIKIDKKLLFPRENERQGVRIRWEVWIKNVGRILQHIHEMCFRWAILSIKPKWLNVHISPSTSLFKINMMKFIKNQIFYRCKNCERWVDSKICSSCNSNTTPITYVIVNEEENLLWIKKERSNSVFPIKKEVKVTPKLFIEVGWILAEGNTNNLGCFTSNRDEKNGFVEEKCFLDYIENLSTLEIIQKVNMGRICWDLWAREIFNNFEYEFTFEDAYKLLFNSSIPKPLPDINEVKKRSRNDPIRKCSVLLQRLCEVGYLKKENEKFQIIKKMKKSKEDLWKEDLRYWISALPKLSNLIPKFSTVLGKAGQNTDAEKWIKDDGRICRDDGSIYKELSMSSSTCVSPLFNKRAPGSLPFELAFNWRKLGDLT